MADLVAASPGDKVLLLGNEAVVRGALEAGLAFASCYPGTPSSEVSNILFALQGQAGHYMEFATNEKVALEVCAGAAVSGIRAMTAMKHVGLNVAADPLMTLAYVGVRAGMVVYVADDPFMFSSQNEQDTRFYAKLSGLPLLEPSSVQELKDMTKYAFDLSEELSLPVLIRSTTRLAHARGVVDMGQRTEPNLKGKFDKAPFDLVPVPAVARKLHPLLLEKQAKATRIANDSPYNKIVGAGEWGVLTHSASFAYVCDGLAELGLSDKVSVLCLGVSHPLPEAKLVGFLQGKTKVLVVEELEPIMEEAAQAVAQRNGITVEIKGKGVGPLSRLYEYQPGIVRDGLAAFFGVKYDGPKPVDVSDLPALPNRPPNLCPGCPHRMTYYAVKEAAGNSAIYPSDIGCYTLGLLPPFSAADFLVCMGSSASSPAGISTAVDTPVISFIGDSTFFHSGMTGLVNAVHNHHNYTLVILDNGITAMTGHQPDPSMDTEMAGLDKTRVSLEKVVRGLGVEHVVKVKPKNTAKTIAGIKEALDHPGLSVVISEEICPLYGRRFKKPSGVVFEVNHDKCTQQRDCLNKFACPAFYLEGDQVNIDPNLCIGCAVCAQVCPEGAIVPRKKGK